jgi:hypothetical protein
VNVIVIVIMNVIVIVIMNVNVIVIVIMNVNVIVIVIVCVFELYTKREELLLRRVLAFPKASRRGFELRMISLTRTTSAVWPECAAMYYSDSINPTKKQSFVTCLRKPSQKVQKMFDVVYLHNKRKELYMF